MLFSKKRQQKNVIALPELGFCAADEQGLATWLSDQPKLPIDGFAKTLLQAGNTLISIESNLEQRCAIINQFEEPVFQVSHGMKFQANTGKDEQLSLVLQQQFNACFGLLFMRLGMDLLHHNTTYPSNAQVVEHYLYRAAALLAKSILASKQAYSTVPKSCWLALHEAMHALLSDPKLTKNDNVTEFTSVYKAAVTLGCAGPEKLNPVDVELMFNYILKNSTLVDLTMHPNEDTRFIASTGHDLPPVYSKLPTGLNAGRPHEPRGNAIYLSYKKLVTTATDSELARLANHMQTTLIERPTREEQRKPDSDNILLNIGINRIHLEISGKATLNDFMRDYKTLTEDTNRFERSKKKTQQRDIWGTVYESHWENLSADVSIEFTQLNTATTTTDLEQITPNTHTEQLIAVKNFDINNNGIGLEGKRNNLTALKAGTLISVTSANAEKPKKKLAIVRWVEKSPTKCRFGAQLLCDTPKAAAIKLIHSQRSSEYLPALIYRETNAQAAENQYFVLFSLSGSTRKTSAKLAFEQREQNILLSECIEQTQEFNIFKIQFAMETGSLNSEPLTAE